MCIICNMPDQEGVGTAISYLHQADEARRSMKAAAAKMLACAQQAGDQSVRRQYDRTHKAMVRAIRTWNKIEHQRELS